MAAGFSEIRETVTNEKERGTSTNANQPAKDDFQESFEKILNSFDGEFALPEKYRYLYISEPVNNTSYEINGVYIFYLSEVFNNDERLIISGKPFTNELNLSTIIKYFFVESIVFDFNGTPQLFRYIIHSHIRIRENFTDKLILDNTNLKSTMKIDRAELEENGDTFVLEMFLQNHAEKILDNVKTGFVEDAKFDEDAEWKTMFGTDSITKQLQNQFAETNDQDY